MFESPSMSTRSSFSPRARVAVLGTAVSAHLALLGFATLASLWRIVPVAVPQPTEAFISVTLPPLEEPIPQAPRPRERGRGGGGPSIAPIANATAAVRPIVQPTTSDLPTATTATLDGPVGSAIGVADGPGVGPGSGSGSGEGIGSEIEAAPIPVAGAVIAPVVLSRIEPHYPQAAILVRRQGVVVVEAEIDTQGTVRGVRAIGPRLGLGLEESAMDAVRAWRFSPARLGSRPVAVYFRLTVRFTLR